MIQNQRISAVRLDIRRCRFVSTEGNTKKPANVQAELIITQRKPKNTFCRSQWRINKKSFDNSALRNTGKKSTKYAGTNYVRSPWEIIHLLNKPLSGLLVCRTIIPSAERLSSKFHNCPPSFAPRPTVHFLDNLSALGLFLRYTSRRKGFIYHIHIHT